MRCGKVAETPAQQCVRRDAAGDDQRAARGPARTEEPGGARGAVEQRVGDGGLERRGEVGRILRRQAPLGIGERAHRLAQRRLEAGERKVAAGPALHRPRQGKAHGIAARGGALDRGTAGIAEAQQLGALVESFGSRSLAAALVPL